MEDGERITLEIPVGMIEGDGGFVIFNTKETDQILGKVSIVIQEESLEEAKRVYLILLKSHIEWAEDRSRQLDKWKPFQKSGKNTMTRSFWFMIFGMHFYFRRGKGMKGGWYIPFTNLNISFHNYWIPYRKPESK